MVLLLEAIRMRQSERRARSIALTYRFLKVPLRQRGA